jgi:hypothetical protein
VLPHPDSLFGGVLMAWDFVKNFTREGVACRVSDRVRDRRHCHRRHCSPFFGSYHPLPAVVCSPGVLKVDRLSCGEATIQLDSDLIGAARSLCDTAPAAVVDTVDIDAAPMQTFLDAVGGSSWRCHRFLSAMHIAMLRELLVDRRAALKNEEKDDEMVSDRRAKTKVRASHVGVLTLVVVPASWVVVVAPLGSGAVPRSRQSWCVLCRTSR